MRLHALRDASADGDFPAAPAVTAERAGRSADIAVFPTRGSRRGVSVTAPDRGDQLPSSPTEFARLRWPAGAAAVTVHLVIVATILSGVLSRTEPAPQDAVEIALVFEPAPKPTALAATEKQTDATVVPTTAQLPPIPLEPPPVATAVEPAPVPPPRPTPPPPEPSAMEQALLPPEVTAPPPKPAVKPAPVHRPKRPAPSVARRETPSPPPQAPAVAAPPAMVAAAPVRTTPVGNLARNRKPEYPAEARRRGLQGQTRLHVEVSAAGAATDVRVVTSSGYPVLDEAALAAVRQWRFDPATLNGRPVDGAVEVPIRFRLDD